LGSVTPHNPSTVAHSVIDVDILGHIFEQSITDFERLRLSLEARAAADGARTFLSAAASDGTSAGENLGASERTVVAADRNPRSKSPATMPDDWSLMTYHFPTFRPARTGSRPLESDGVSLSC
jgi:hypothetical protein